MMEESIVSFKTDLFDYQLLAKSYSKLAEIYENQDNFVGQIDKIEDRDQKIQALTSRENILKPQYFCVKFDTIVSKSRNWLRFLSGKTFVYRGDTIFRFLFLRFFIFTFLIARASDLQAKMEVWFPSAVVKVGTGKTGRKESAILDILTITIFKVDPVPVEGGIFHNKKVPPQALEYPLNNATNVFVMKKMFERNRNKENPNASTFAKNFLFITKFSLPGPLRWSEVIEEIDDIETTPIQNTLSMLQLKNQELQFFFMKLDREIRSGEDTDLKSVPLQTVGQSLKGIIIPEVGGGIPKIEEAFINEVYKAEHPEDNIYINMMQKEIVRQMDLCKKLLQIHGSFISPAMEQLQRVMQEELNKMKKDYNEKYGYNFSEVYMVNSHDYYKIKYF